MMMIEIIHFRLSVQILTDCSSTIWHNQHDGKWITFHIYEKVFDERGINN